MDTIELRTHLLALEAERASASVWGLTEVALYIDELEDEISHTREAYLAAAVIEIASLRAQLAGPQLG